jgi:hypothetical protein
MYVIYLNYKYIEEEVSSSDLMVSFHVIYKKKIILFYSFVKN